MQDRYINMEDLLVQIDANREFSQLTGNFDKVRVLVEVRELIEEMPYINVPHPKPSDAPILYRHTGERE